MLEWLHITGCQWESSTCDAVAWEGHLEMVLKWARELGCPWNKVNVRACAARRGHQEMVTWLDGLVDDQ